MNAIETVQAPEDPNSETEEGALYEIVINVQSKFDAKHVEDVINLVHAGDDISNYGAATVGAWNKMAGYWAIQDIVAESDVWRDVVPLVNTGPSEQWRLRIRATKLGGTPVLVAVGVILALLIILVGIVSWQAYKIQPVLKPIENTFIVVAVAAVVIAALVFGRKLT